MISREILKIIRQIELRTNRIVTGFAVGARTSARFTVRTTTASKANLALNFIRPLKRCERRAPVIRNSKPIEFDGFGNYGEFAIIKKSGGQNASVLIPSNFKGLEFETFRKKAGLPQGERLKRLNQIAIRQMQVLTSSNLKSLPGTK